MKFRSANIRPFSRTKGKNTHFFIFFREKFVCFIKTNYFCTRKSAQSRWAMLIGLWCNGNTADSGPAFPGSSPGSPTNRQISLLANLFFYSSIVFQTLSASEVQLTEQREQNQTRLSYAESWRKKTELRSVQMTPFWCIFFLSFGWQIVFSLLTEVVKSSKWLKWTVK